MAIRLKRICISDCDHRPVFLLPRQPYIALVDRPTQLTNTKDIAGQSANIALESSYEQEIAESRCHIISRDQKF